MKDLAIIVVLVISIGLTILAITTDPERKQPPPLLHGTVYVPTLPEIPPLPDVDAILPPPSVELSATPTPTVPPWNAEPEINCIAIAVFAESRGESVLGQALVASTVVNRARNLAIDECAVISASGQYHATLSADPWLIDEDAWRRSLDIASVVRDGEYDLASCRGVTHFHANHVTPHWSSTLNYACKVDGHTYYRMPQ